MEHIQHGRSVMVVMDYKENVAINQNPEEVGTEYFRKPQRTIFGMVLIYKNENNEINKIYFDFISECLKHNAYFVKYAFDKFLSHSEVQKINFNSIWICTDNAKHFRNKELLGYFNNLVIPLRSFKKLDKVVLNPQFNRVSAFTLEEREILGLNGLFPHTVETLDKQTQMQIY
jgi:hypothetical protein